MPDQSSTHPLRPQGQAPRRRLHLSAVPAGTALDSGTTPHLITLQGDIDIQRRPDLSREVDRFRASGRCTVMVDLSDVGFLDSTGLQMFLRLRAVAAERGGSVRLRAANHRVLRILDVTGVTPLFTLEA
ncbi:MAG: STAS domain-containing protein [Candidatus Nanopelagicales bacterium]